MSKINKNIDIYGTDKFYDYKKCSRKHIDAILNGLKSIMIIFCKYKFRWR